MSETGAPARSGYRRSAPGMVGALLACLALFAAIWAMSSWQRHDTANPVSTVDYSGQLAQARSTAPFEVLAPHPAPAGWRATSARYSNNGTDASWHLGFLTSGDEEYVGLEQSNAVTSSFLATFPADQPGDPVKIDGRRWQTLSSSNGKEHAIYREGDSVTTLITGTASQAEIETFAESLSAR